MKEILLLHFSCDFHLSPPKLLDCNGRRVPCLIRQTQNNNYRISTYQDEIRTEADFLFNFPKEELCFLYSEQWGLEVLKKERSNRYGLWVEKERFNQKIVPQKTKFDPCLFFYGYIGAGNHLCLEKQNGPIVCRTEDGTRLWQTEETYIWPSNHWPTVTQDWIEILDFDRRILSVYSLNGEKLKTCCLPDSFQDAQYSPKLNKDGDLYYMEGFWGDINKFVRVYLDTRKETEILFTLPPELYAPNCYIYNHKFLYIGIGYRKKRYGDLGILISLKENGYVTKEIFFHPCKQQYAGGGQVKWIDDEHFYYWNSSNSTTLFCYNINGQILFQIRNLGYFYEEDLTVFQNHTYILSHKNSKNWKEREYFWTILVQ